MRSSDWSSDVCSSDLQIGDWISQHDAEQGDDGADLERAKIDIAEHRLFGRDAYDALVDVQPPVERREQRVAGERAVRMAPGRPDIPLAPPCIDLHQPRKSGGAGKRCP